MSDQNQNESAKSSYEEKLQRFSNMVSTKTMQGFMVADRNDKTLTAVLIKQAEKINHLLHFVITVFTCGWWGIAWIIIYFTKGREHRVRITIDSAGNAIEEKIKI
jgi:hypothetical protein